MSFWCVSWVVEDADYSDSRVVEVALSASMLSDDTSDAPWSVQFRVQLPRDEGQAWGMDDLADEAINRARAMMKELMT